MIYNDTIVALSTPAGMGAIAVLRISGSRAIEIVDSVFHSPVGKSLKTVATHTAHFGLIRDADDVIDEVVATVFRAPRSYTGEDTVEISCHGSVYVQNTLLQLFIRRGARMASAGEFTRRAFVSGRMDLSQAEAVADLIESESSASHATAIYQMRGGYSQVIASLRDKLVDFASLLELELDFSDEDVEFADRERLRVLLEDIRETIEELTDSFAVGNVIKNGIPVAIVGSPNVGKSTLLNALVGEERAIVSHIPGTTRDTVEDEINIGGIRFRFIDTAGLRTTDDEIERIGIDRARKKIEEAVIVIYMTDSAHVNMEWWDEIEHLRTLYPSKHIIPVENKIDVTGQVKAPEGTIYISAKERQGLDTLRERLLYVSGVNDLSSRMIVTNARHYDALLRASVSIDRVVSGMQVGLTADLLSVDIREAINILAEITGDVSSDDILGAIFSRFCIGK
ncbi:MAG: tRNA uridine-5-carboxymethylaminomethyl(34) synthesis GTPase MnmE [Flavobacteriales bacterium]|nr:tRNA uridine-5-carboxymethylaminomethyl(34) synthesis GTPase MnmE [Flavobacteriales bacterium]